MARKKFSAGYNGDPVADLCDNNFGELYSAFLKFGTPYYVDSINGSDTLYDGLSIDHPFQTIAKFVATASDGDRAIMRGTFTEAVTCTKKLAFLGSGPTPDHCVWMESAAGQTLLSLISPDCFVSGIRFRVPTTGGIAIDMLNSDFTQIRGNIFQGRAGSYYGIRVSGGSQWRILDNSFSYMNTATYGCAILGYSVLSIPSGCDVSGNVFQSNLRHIAATLRQSYVHDNTLQAVGIDADNVSALTATVKIDISGETSGGQFNTVTRNNIQGTYSVLGGFKSATGDNWYGNKSDKISTTGVTAEGTTIAVPA